MLIPQQSPKLRLISSQQPPFSIMSSLGGCRPIFLYGHIPIWPFISFALGFISASYIERQNQYELEQPMSSEKTQTTHTQKNPNVGQWAHDTERLES